MSVYAADTVVTLAPETSLAAVARELIEDQIGMGDYVTIADVNGVIEEIQLRITQLRDADGTIWYFRNGDIGKVANYSQGSGTGLPPEPAAS